MSDASKDAMVAAFTALRDRLEAAGLSYTSAAYRDDAMSLLVNEPGEYWEIDVLEDGSVDVEIYASRGLCEDPMGEIDRLVRRGGDDPTPPLSERN